ncbi:hypothetical protein GBA52_020083 [Prunus armeniaca]|nr:hypothetical protein GBA52_020083 [Prunus armeniaca]
MGILKVQWVEKHDKYLGLPTFVGRSKIVCFNPIKERIWGKFQGWKEKMLSFAGKEVLLKVVGTRGPNEDPLKEVEPFV